jgi:IMP and pyridine-specific 5'-nucleotidase
MTAGYPRDPISYEKRFSALIETFREHNTPREVLSRFYVVGGECNYLFRMSTKVDEGNKEKKSVLKVCIDPFHLEYVPSEEWLDPLFLKYEENDISEFLNKANQCLVENTKKLLLDQKFRIIRKERAVGVFSVVIQVEN